MGVRLLIGILVIMLLAAGCVQGVVETTPGPAETTDAGKNLFLAAGQSILANTNQRAVEGFNMGFLLLSIAGVIVSIVMLRSKTFSKVIAYVGVLAFAVSLADYIRIIFMPSIPLLLLIIAIASGLLLLIWLVLIARRLFQLGATGVTF